MLLRAMVIYFIMSLFRRPQQPINNSATGQVSTTKGAATNLFSLNTVMDLYVFVSEQVGETHQLSNLKKNFFMS